MKAVEKTLGDQTKHITELIRQRDEINAKLEEAKASEAAAIKKAEEYELRISSAEVKLHDAEALTHELTAKVDALMADKLGEAARVEAECMRVWSDAQDQMIPAFEEAKKKSFKHGWDTALHACHVPSGSDLFAMHGVRGDMDMEVLPGDEQVDAGDGVHAEGTVDADQENEPMTLRDGSDHASPSLPSLPTGPETDLPPPPPPIITRDPSTELDELLGVGELVRRRGELCGEGASDAAGDP